MTKPTVLDIFCGAGGMSEGFIQAGFDVAFACDINEHAQATYLNRHRQLGYNVKFACVDIREFSKEDFLREFLDGRKIDIVCGGPPCQGFSTAGKRDQADPRNILFKSYVRTIQVVQPDYFVMENVEGILSMVLEEFTGLNGRIYKNNTIPEILNSEFYEIGYAVKFEVLHANNYGVPQNRKRVFFLGNKIIKLKKTFINVVVPSKFPRRFGIIDINVRDAIDDLKFLDSGHKSKEYENNIDLSNYQMQSKEGRTPNIFGKGVSAKALYNHEASKHSKRVIERFSLMQQGEILGNLKKRLPDLWSRFPTKKIQCFRINSEQVSPTITTLPDDLVHYCRDRIMSVREMARLQSFDDSFEFLGPRTTGGVKRKTELPQYSQVGNAVPPLMAKAVACSIQNAISKTMRIKRNRYYSTLRSRGVIKCQSFTFELMPKSKG